MAATGRFVPSTNGKKLAKSCLSRRVAAEVKKLLGS